MRRTWSVESRTADTRNIKSRYTAVVANGASDVWAFGSVEHMHHSGGKPIAALAMHWDGTSWSRVVAAKRPHPMSDFEGASSDGVGGVWAVGHEWDEYADRGTPLVEHWDGSQWQVAPMKPQRVGSALLSVSATGPDQAWAVGVDTTQPLVMQWNGRIWR